MNSGNLSFCHLSREIFTNQQGLSNLSNLRRFFPVTLLLIVVSGMVFLLTNMGESGVVLESLLISRPESLGFQDVASGEIWRPLTPIFLHFGPMHLIFNMLWLWDIGGLTEQRKGSLFILVFTLVVGIAANIAQYLIGQSLFFGGMSGVLYGILGYLWMQGRYNPQFGVVLSKQTVITMLVWYVLCWTGLLGPIANWAHTVGLVLGMIWGFVEAKSARAG